MTRHATRRTPGLRHGATHYKTPEGDAACSGRLRGVLSSRTPAYVTCKRCLAAMKRESERELEIKAAMTRPKLRCDLCSSVVHADVFTVTAFACPFCAEGTMQPETTMADRKRVDWSRVDWTDGVKDLARAAELGVHVSTVSSARRAAGHTRPRRYIDWGSVDLTRPTAELARELGTHPDTPRVARSRLRRAAKKRARGENAP